MKKYLFIIKTQFMSNLQYIFDIVVGFIGHAIMLFILFNLWKYLYSDPNELINGYNMSQMTWYVIVTEILWMSLGGRTLCSQISNEVKNGDVTYKINKPYDYVGYCLSSHLGKMVIKFVMYIILCSTLGFIFLGTFPKLSVLKILFIVLTGILATIISILLLTSIGLISFFIEDSGPFYWVYSKFILVLGTLFPIEFFPTFMQGIMKYSPIYVVSYGPAKLFVDFSWTTGLSILIAQVIYILISYGICQLIYRKGVKRINVNGG